MNEGLVISFDLDGTAWKYRREFSALAHILKSSGHKVGILTAHNENLMEADIRLWKARGFPDADFYICRSSAYRENRYASMGTGRWKSEMLLEHNIDIHFEDFDDGKYEDEFNAFAYLCQHAKTIRIK